MARTAAPVRQRPRVLCQVRAVSLSPAPGTAIASANSIQAILSRCPTRACKTRHIRCTLCLCPSPAHMAQRTAAAPRRCSPAFQASQTTSTTRRIQILVSVRLALRLRRIAATITMRTATATAGPIRLVRATAAGTSAQVQAVVVIAPVAPRSKAASVIP